MVPRHDLMTWVASSREHVGEEVLGRQTGEKKPSLPTKGHARITSNRSKPNYFQNKTDLLVHLGGGDRQISIFES